MSEAGLRTNGSLESQPRMGVRNLRNFIYCPRRYRSPKIIHAQDFANIASLIEYRQQSIIFLRNIFLEKLFLGKTTYVFVTDAIQTIKAINSLYSIRQAALRSKNYLSHVVLTLRLQVKTQFC